MKKKVVRFEAITFSVLYKENNVPSQYSVKKMTRIRIENDLHSWNDEPDPETTILNILKDRASLGYI